MDQEGFFIFGDFESSKFQSRRMFIAALFLFSSGDFA